MQTVLLYMLSLMSIIMQRKQIKYSRSDDMPPRFGSVHFARIKAIVPARKLVSTKGIIVMVLFSEFPSPLRILASQIQPSRLGQWRCFALFP